MDVHVAMTQFEHYEMARRNLAAANEIFMDMVNDKVNPMTSSDLRALIERRPSMYSKFDNWIKVLEDRECVAKNLTRSM